MNVSPFEGHQSLEGENGVRPPIQQELWAVAQAHVDAGLSPDEAVGITESSHYAVIEKYATDCPGYAGRVVVEIGGGAPSYFCVFIEDNDGENLRKLDRDPDLQP